MSTLAHHLPALLIVIPLMAAPIAVLLRRPAAAWSLAMVVTFVVFAISLALLDRVMTEGAIVYEMGGWAAPWGIVYRIDMVSAFVAVIVASIGAVVAPGSRIALMREVPNDRIYLFYTMYLLCLTGLLGMTVTGDAFNLFVFLEISSLSTYVLVSLGRDRRALTAALRYLMMGTVGATFYVIAIGLLYGKTGTLNMLDMAERLPAVATSPTVLAGFAFMIVGIGVKMAMFPLHFWLPNAYAYAPSAATAFLAATATKVSVYVLLRVLFTIFGATGLLTTLPVGQALMSMAIVGMFVGSLVAIYQPDVKRAVAFSSVAQIGYMVLGISLLSETGLAAAIVHLFNHALMKGALFLVTACMFLRVGSTKAVDLAGLGRQMPLTMAALVVGGLSLIGVPGTVGFVSKWYLVQALLQADLMVVALLVLVSSLLAVIYIWRLVEIAYFKPAPEGREVKEAPLSVLIPTWILAGACIWFGIDGTNTMEIALEAAASLLETLP